MPPKLTIAADDASPLHDQRDWKLRKRSDKGAAPELAGTAAAAAHEIENHRRELESQNRELREARRELERVVERYRDLYDLAPIGYLTLDPSGIIHEANLTACSLLGVTRTRLYQRSLFSSVPIDEREELRTHLREVFSASEKRRCELQLRRGDNEMWISLESVRDEKGYSARRCRTVISDVTDRKVAQLALLEAHFQLEQRVRERTLDLERANSTLKTQLVARSQAENALRGSQATLRVLASEAALAEQRERKHLASDLHDGLSQLLTLSRIKLESIGQRDGNGSAESLCEVRVLLTQAQAHAESLTFQLSPPLLHDVGLVAAAERLGDDIQRTYGLRVKVHARGEHRPDDEALRVTVFRALRELMLNAGEHARAKHLTVRFASGGGRIFITVEDDGIGPDDEALQNGFGLSNARERMAYLGGSLALTARAGGGTRAKLTVPPPRRFSRK